MDTPNSARFLRQVLTFLFGSQLHLIKSRRTSDIADEGQISVSRLSYRTQTVVGKASPFAIAEAAKNKVIWARCRC